MTVPSLYVGAGRVLTMTPWGAKIFTSADDLSLMPDIALTGEYDGPFLRFLERTIRPGDTVVDVGANVGLFTLRMAWLTGPSGRVLAFEPHPKVRRFLSDNVAVNYASWVDVSAVAAGASAGRRTLYAPARFQGNASLVAKNEWYGHHFGDDAVDAYEVDVGRLDDLVPSDVHLRLVKVDVEGAEAEVLDGMRAIMDDRRCELVDVEVSRPLGNVEFDALIARLGDLRDAGATLAEIDGNGNLVAITLDEVVVRGRLPHLVVSLR